MNCKNIRELLPLFVGHDLDDKRKAHVTSHVETCHECSVAAEEYRASRQLLKHFAPPQFGEDIYDGIRQSVLREIGREAAAPSGSQLFAKLFQPRLRLAFATALLLAVAGFSYYFITMRTSEQPLVSETGRELKPGATAVINPTPSPLQAPNGPPQSIIVQRHNPSATNGAGADRPYTERKKNTVATPNLVAAKSPDVSTRQINNLVAPNANPAAAEEPLRVEIQTRDQNIRIIWFAQPIKQNSPGKSSKQTQEARSDA
jgi:Putative zinc-finger